MDDIKTERVLCYIDGFNLYYGLKEKGWRRYYWLNLRLLVENLLKPNQELISIKYFTARISAGDGTTTFKLKEKLEAKRRRQMVYLEALSTLENFTMFEGHYLAKTVSCNNCGATWNTFEEKMTDVRIATELIFDSFNNVFDTALIISGDSDLVPPIDAARGMFPSKRVVIAFPPARNSERLKKAATAYFRIGETNLRKSIFPEEVTKSDGFVLRRPAEWERNNTL